MKLPPVTQPEQRELFWHRMLTDTGFFARNVLDFDTDKDENGNATGKVGEGGVRDYGPHKEVIEFLDDKSNEHCIILAPRFSYKSSILQAFILRNILAHPNIAILLYMHEQKLATERVDGLRKILEENPIIVELYGDLRGPKWTQGSFITRLRDDRTLQTPTLMVATPSTGVAGKRPNLVIFDDIVAETDKNSELKLKRACDCIEHSLALRSRGTRYIDVGTPYSDADAHQWCIDAGWNRLIHLDVGFDVSVNEKGLIELSGDARWPNLPIEFVRKYLKSGEDDGKGGGMSYPTFMSQFMLKIVAGLKQAFQRHQFVHEQWDGTVHSQLTGYLLTDTAPSGSKEGDLNVLMYVGIDEDRCVYILDLEIGYWESVEFCRRYIAMLQRWQKKVNHRKEMWEKGHDYLSYMPHIRIAAKEQKVRLSDFACKRNQGAPSKDARIAGCAYRFQNGEVRVMSTVPRHWNAGTEMRELWNPASQFDSKTKAPIPGGDLVEQFIRFPSYKKKDIPDAFSLLDAMDETGDQRVCFHVKSSVQRMPDAVERKPIENNGPRFKGSTTRFYDKVRGIAKRGNVLGRLGRAGHFGPATLRRGGE